MGTFKKQVGRYGPRAFKYCDTPATITAEVRFDDNCGNGHNSFAITADIREATGVRRWIAGGCCHDEIAQVFPELAPLIKWHLCSSDGPMHYLQNTIFLAGDRDCWGHVKGQPHSYETVIQFGKNPIKHKFGKAFTKFLQDAKPHNERGAFDFEVLRIDHENRAGDTYKFQPKYTFGGFDAKWYQCPFDDEQEALDFLTALQTCDPQFITTPTAWGEGKERELDGARRAAIWPEATDEDLTAPGLEDRLKARLPKLLEDFRAAVESLGLKWESGKEGA